MSDLNTVAAVASILGFLLAMIGFTWTIWQATAARREATKANRVAEAVLRQLLASNASTAHWLARDFSRSCNEGKWEEAAFKIQHLHQVLARLEANETLEKKHRDVIALAVDDLNQIAEHLHAKIVGEDPVSPLSVQSRRRIADLVRFLTRLEAKTQTPALGDLL